MFAPSQFCKRSIMIQVEHIPNKLPEYGSAQKSTTVGDVVTIADESNNIPSIDAALQQLDEEKQRNVDVEVNQLLNATMESVSVTQSNLRNRSKDADSVRNRKKRKMTKCFLRLLLFTFLASFVTFLIIDSTNDAHVKRIILDFLHWLEDHAVAGLFIFIFGTFTITKQVKITLCFQRWGKALLVSLRKKFLKFNLSKWCS